MDLAADGGELRPAAAPPRVGIFRRSVAWCCLLGRYQHRLLDHAIRTEHIAVQHPHSVVLLPDANVFSGLDVLAHSNVPDVVNALLDGHVSLHRTPFGLVAITD